jgi:hypothetical protein
VALLQWLRLWLRLWLSCYVVAMLWHEWRDRRLLVLLRRLTHDHHATTRADASDLTATGCYTGARARNADGPVALSRDAYANHSLEVAERFCQSCSAELIVA